MRDILNRFLELLKHIVTIVLDLVFLYVWALLVKYAHTWVEPHVIGLAGIDTAVFGVLQLVFALSTVYPVVVSLYRDFAIMMKRARVEIQRA